MLCLMEQNDYFSPKLVNLSECFDLLDIFEHEKGLSTYVTVSVSNVATGNHGNQYGRKRWAVIGRTYIVEVGTDRQTH